MSNSRDLQDFFYSDVLKSYISKELEKEAADAESAKFASKEFEELQHKINSSPHLKTVFRKLQEVFTKDEAYTKQADQLFVEGVLMLDLEDE